MLSSHLTNHFSRDRIELVIKVCLLELDEPADYVLDLLMAILENEVLAFLHLIDLVELLPDPRHRVLRNAIGKLLQLLVCIRLLRLQAEIDPRYVTV